MVVASGRKSIGWDWELTFTGPLGPDPAHPAALVPGTYTIAPHDPLSRTSSDLDVGGFGAACSGTGSFTITKVVFGPNGYVQAFDATFVKHCASGGGGDDALHGEVHIANPPAPAPSPSPTPLRTTTGGGAHVARGGGAGGPSTPTPWTDADRARFMAIGLGVIAVVILVVNVVIAGRSRRLRQAYLSRESRPAWPATMAGAVMRPGSGDRSVERRWLQYDPSPPVARRSLPGKVIAVSVVLAVRGMLGLLLTFAAIGALQLRAMQQLALPSWYANVLWLQLVICAGEVVFGLLLLLGKEWPRMLGLSVLWFDIAAGILVMFTNTFSFAGLFGIAVDAVLIWMLFWHEVTDWCY
jgi:hypothetical protein